MSVIIKGTEQVVTEADITIETPYYFTVVDNPASIYVRSWFYQLTDYHLYEIIITDYKGGVSRNEKPYKEYILLVRPVSEALLTRMKEYILNPELRLSDIEYRRAWLEYDRALKDAGALPQPLPTPTPKATVEERLTEVEKAIRELRQLPNY